MASNILVTGSGGFIGRHLAAALQACGHNLHRLSSADGDIARMTIPPRPVDHVFHLAGRSFVPDSWRNPRDFYDANVVGTANVLEFCRASGASITFLSSYVYGVPRSLPISETHPIAAANPYAHSKILAEEVTAWYRDVFKIRAMVIRSFNVFGPGQPARHIIPLLIGQTLDATRDTIEVADKRPKRDYMFVNDLVALLLATIGREGGVYNAGSGRSASVGELALLINEAAGTNKTLVSRDEPRPGEVLDEIADISKVKRELGWEPLTSLRDGIAATVAAAIASR